MDLTQDLAKVKDLVDKAQNVLIATHERPTFDSIGASLALSLGLASLGKKVTVACPDPITVALSSFVGVDKILTDVEKKNFIISLDYIDGSIEKVSYNIEGDKFNLVIEPRPGFDTFSADKVHYSYAGAAADLVFTVDTIHLGGLKKLYDADKNLFASKPVVNVDRHPNNAHYGQINLIDASVSSTAEVVARLLSSLGVRLAEDIATNLLNAIIGATNNFQSPAAGAATFELAAACMKAGGKRFSAAMAQTEEFPQGETVAREMPREAPKVGTQGVLPKTIVQEAAQRLPTGQQGQAPRETSGQAPADWLKPKIFKSSNLS